MPAPWPKGIKAKGQLRHQFLHATDIVPTMYDLLGVELPDEVKGYPQIPLEGVSFKSTFLSDDVPTPKQEAFFSMLGSRAVWHKGWKAVSVHPTIAGWGKFDQDRWELYDTTVDPTESNDLAAKEPVKLQEMINHWFHMRRVDFVDGTRRRASTLPVPEVRPGDWGLVAAGTLVRLLDPELANEIADAVRAARRSESSSLPEAP